MKPRHLLLSLSAVLLMGALAACTEKEDKPAAAKVDKSSVDYVAVVNDELITRDDFNEFIRLKQSMQPGVPQNPTIVLNEMINMEVLEQEAVKAGIEQRPDVAQQLERQRTNLLVNTLLRDRIESMDITDEQVKQEYDTQVAGMEKTEYKARHILVESEDQAKAVIAELDKGADFAELATEKSTGPSGPQGGDLGWFNPKQMVPPFAAAVSELEKGKYSKTPVQTKFGWHVIYLEDTRDVNIPALDQVKDQLKNQIARNQVNAYILELRNGATIETNLGTPAVAPPAAPAPATAPAHVHEHPAAQPAEQAPAQ